MYIFQKNFCFDDIMKKQEPGRRLVVILPSQKEKKIGRLKQLIRECVKELNKETGDSEKWRILFLNHEDPSRTPDKNYALIYLADAVIAECTDNKENVFYLMGLAHACGRPVCACYEVDEGKHVEIPFNVHGRQSLKYSLKAIEKQQKMKTHLKEWLAKL